MSKLSTHRFVHCFHSGNHARVCLAVPPRGKAFRYFVHWAHDPGAADEAEYSRWKDYIVKVLEPVARRRLQMMDDADRPANRRAIKASL